ncbi:glycosyltransferase family 4 protein [Nocardioides sp. TRM66260-LWL]|uniref:glycosyltransferase family 4 protein n=1 Tax=Nocardioides sp. TRM66260-LWL TaxID=2874478 RepID=UPI001CC6D29D|nr:glycosyltransferase family 4 protein [Nocardioides sp. TRM66260-LWL]MBZ5734933.1 glycosyltransferase family 4 protein [Nocardioides sp. TRM66260-LWL]
MVTAAVVYWYPEDGLPMDGGGQRAAAWLAALRSLGFDTKLVSIHDSTPSGDDTAGSRLGSLKRAVLPMPFARHLPPDALDADICVVTVPAVMPHAAKVRTPGSLVFDWMDLWSVNARNIGDASNLSRLGGRLQSTRWRRVEIGLTDRWPSAFAGYGDLVASGGRRSVKSSWLPTPVRRRPQPASHVGLRRVGFIGNLHYPPNVISLRSYLSQNAIRFEQAGIELVVGGYGSETAATWGFPVTVIGEIGDLDEFYESIDAAVVPIEHGGGIKVKAIEALAYGRPVFTTPHVREGFSPEFAPYLLSADALFAGAAVRAAPVPPELFDQHFSHEAFRNGVGRILESVR